MYLLKRQWLLSELVIVFQLLVIIGRLVVGLVKWTVITGVITVTL